MTSRTRARSRIVALALGLASLLPLAAPAVALPAWPTGRPVGALTVYADDRRAGLFYYAPPEIQVATRDDGAPDFHFLETVYTGSATGRDQGMITHKSLVTFRVRLPRVPAADLTSAAQTLGAGGRPAELRPFPIRRLSAALVYSVIGGADTSAAVALPDGRFEASDSGETAAGSFWTERIYAVGLDSLTAQAFRAALERGRVLMSLAYAFLGEAIGGEDDEEGTLQGSPELVAALQRNIASGQHGPAGAPADSARLHTIRAGAIGIGLDTTRWPDLMRRVDLNDRAPPGYAALDVYCYDFNNELRPDLAEKRVEIDAEGVGGRRVTLQTYFKSEQPDLYSTSVRFPVAVRLDRPYRYRVEEVKRDGSAHAGSWREVARWSQILDVTTPPKEAGVRSLFGP
ncbi:MAG TPA: hypothetical protein VF363_05820 [Candidatus Eisenbacteria bacterium]